MWPTERAIRGGRTSRRQRPEHAVVRPPSITRRPRVRRAGVVARVRAPAIRHACAEAVVFDARCAGRRVGAFAERRNAASTEADRGNEVPGGRRVVAEGLRVDSAYLHHVESARAALHDRGRRRGTCRGECRRPRAWPSTTAAVDGLRAADRRTERVSRRAPGCVGAGRVGGPGIREGNAANGSARGAARIAVARVRRTLCDATHGGTDDASAAGRHAVLRRAVGCIVAPGFGGYRSRAIRKTRVRGRGTVATGSARREDEGREQDSGAHDEYREHGMCQVVLVQSSAISRRARVPTRAYQDRTRAGLPHAHRAAGNIFAALAAAMAWFLGSKTG